MTTPGTVHYSSFNPYGIWPTSKYIHSPTAYSLQPRLNKVSTSYVTEYWLFSSSVKRPLRWNIHLRWGYRYIYNRVTDKNASSNSRYIQLVISDINYPIVFTPLEQDQGEVLNLCNSRFNTSFLRLTTLLIHALCLPKIAKERFRL